MAEDWVGLTTSSVVLTGSELNGFGESVVETGSVAERGFGDFSAGGTV
jgi:hypothetical protein